MNSVQNANDERHYLFITAAIFIGLTGLFLRFLSDAAYFTWIGNVVLITGVGVALKGVFGILK